MLQSRAIRVSAGGVVMPATGQLSPLDELMRVWRLLPSIAVRPENRRVTTLRVTQWVPRGMVYRYVLTDPTTVQESGYMPRIILHPDDANDLRLQICATPWGRQQTRAVVDQEIADICEELFA